MNNGTQYFDIIPYRAAMALNIFAKNLSYVDQETNLTVDLRSSTPAEFKDKVESFLTTAGNIFNDNSAEQNQIDREFAIKYASNTLLRFDFDLIKFGERMIRNRLEAFALLGRSDLIENLEQLTHRAYSVFNNYAVGNQAYLNEKLKTISSEFLNNNNNTYEDTIPFMKLVYSIGRNDELYEAIAENYKLFQTCHDSSNVYLEGLYDEYCLEIAAETANRLFHWLYVSINSMPNSDKLMTMFGIKYGLASDDASESNDLESGDSSDVASPDGAVGDGAVSDDTIVVAENSPVAYGTADVLHTEESVKSDVD